MIIHGFLKGIKKIYRTFKRSALTCSILQWDEIYREKLKIKKVSDDLSDTFDDMLNNY